MDSNVNYQLNAKYKDGILNELYKRVVTKSVVIDSRFRDNYNNNTTYYVIKNNKLIKIKILLYI